MQITYTVEKNCTSEFYSVSENPRALSGKYFLSSVKPVGGLNPNSGLDGDTFRGPLMRKMCLLGYFTFRCDLKICGKNELK